LVFQVGVHVPRHAVTIDYLQQLYASFVCDWSEIFYNTDISLFSFSPFPFPFS
jgi:hypothetical protein